MEANAAFIVRACNAHDEMYGLIERFGGTVTDMFEQMLKGSWKDCNDHDVQLNEAMLRLKDLIGDAIKLRAALAKSERK